MFFRDMADQSLYEFHDRDCFFNIDIVFMPVVVEGDEITVILIDSGCGDDWSAKVTTDIFDRSSGITFVGLCVDIETMFVVPVTG